VQYSCAFETIANVIVASAQPSAEAGVEGIDVSQANLNVLLRFDKKDSMPVQKDKIREHLGKHLHELSTGDLNILYGKMIGLKPVTDSAEAHLRPRSLSAAVWSKRFRYIWMDRGDRVVDATDACCAELAC